MRAPIYYTVGWSAADAEAHPDWCVRTREGKIAATSWDEQAAPATPKPPVQWKHLCPSGEYHAHMRAQTEELCRLYPVDGFWYDIYQPQCPATARAAGAGWRRRASTPQTPPTSSTFAP